jgi:hypothetical protein
MPEPKPEVLEAALSALRSDSDVWASLADDLTAAKEKAEGLSLEAKHFSYIADQFGMTAEYKKFQDKLARLLGEGAANGYSVATQLMRAAVTYEQEEREGVHRMKGVW